MGDGWQDRVEELFGLAAELPPDRRAAFLDAACGGDAALRAEIQALLAYDTEDESPLLASPVVRPSVEPTVFSDVPSPGPPVLVPPRLGRYRVVRLLGEGGMGAVYEAEQDNPRRAVALKVVRPGLASATLLKRFAHEARILGRLRHPGIAQVFEAGVADDGRPFFAMEFVRGEPLDAYCRLREMAPVARLELLARVCDAVQHAHDQGVIHRDLKPANILVDEAGQPKVLDFGVARVTDADLLTEAGLTQTGQLIGTPNYMSPEQVSADPAAIDHRADVYALGVILFELVAHRLPHRLDNRPLAEVARLIQEQEAPRLGSLDPRLRGDVETIAAKALEKDKTRRYTSAADLAADLRRWLAHEPIKARPPSALYHLGKFARRNKALVGGIVATGAALVLGLIGTSLFAVGEARQRSVAEQEKREALFQAYHARLAAATAALQDHDVTGAARHLEAAPRELRGWEWHHLNSRLDDSTSAIPLPSLAPAFLLAAPEGLRVGALTEEGLSLQDLGGNPLGSRPIRTKAGDSICAMPTRRGLLLATWDGATAVRLFDEAGHLLCRADLPESRTGGPLAVSPDGTRLACSVNLRNRLRIALFDAATGKRTAVCEGHQGGLWNLCYSPDGTRLASTGEDRVTRLWDSATGELLATCRGHGSKVLGVAFRPDGSRLVTTSFDGTVRQWDAVSGREVEPPYERHFGEVAVAAYSPDGQWIASGGTDRTVRVWQAKDRHDVAVLHGHTGIVISVAFAPDGRRLASLSAESNLLAAGDGTVRVWDIDPRATLPVLRGHDNYIYPVAFRPDGRRIASGDWDGKVRLWDAATGEPVGDLTYPGAVHSLAWSPDGLWLAVGGDGTDRLRIWDVETAQIRREIGIPDTHVREVAVRPDGTQLAVTVLHRPTKTYQFHVNDVASGEWLFSAEGWALAYSPDGRWLAAKAADEKTVLLRDAQTFEPVASFHGHEKRVMKAAFSPDSRLLASCGVDRLVRLWSIEGDTSRALPGHTDEVFAVAFHPDGTRLATAGRDRAVWLWDVERGEEVARLSGHTSYVWSLAFSPDGKTLVSGSGDATVRLWDTTPLKDRYQARKDGEVGRIGAR